MDKYHQTNPPTELKSAVMGRENSRKGSTALPCSRCSDLQEEVESLRNAIRLASAKFDAVSWGWDGDCGSGRIIEELENILPENSNIKES